MFKIMHKNKKGFSLAELLVTIVIVGMVISLGGQILYQLTNFHNTATYRWKIQSAVQLACRKFESERDSITNAYQADILYDPVVEGGITVKDDGTFTWKDGSVKALTMPEEGVKDNDDLYTYVFSAPAYGTDGAYKGVWLFIRNYGSTNSVCFLEDEGMGDVPVEIEFSIATSAESLREDENGNPDPTNPKYLNNTIAVKFKSGREDLTVYEVDTAYTLVNTRENSGKRINYNGAELTYELEWGNNNGNNNLTAMAGPAGWTNEELNVATNVGYPGDSNGNATTHYQIEGEPNKRQVTLSNINKSANVMRFISPTAFHAKSNVDELTSGANMASCLSSWAYMDSSAEEQSVVLGGLRDFRDNILSGTVIGDGIIDLYYNTVSPFVVNNLAFTKPVIKAVLKPLSFICGIIANI